MGPGVKNYINVSFNTFFTLDLLPELKIFISPSLITKFY